MLLCYYVWDFEQKVAKVSEYGHHSMFRLVASSKFIFPQVYCAILRQPSTKTDKSTYCTAQYSTCKQHRRGRSGCENKHEVFANNHATCGLAKPSQDLLLYVVVLVSCSAPKDFQRERSFVRVSREIRKFFLPSVLSENRGKDGGQGRHTKSAYLEAICDRCFGVQNDNFVAREGNVCHTHWFESLLKHFAKIHHFDCVAISVEGGKLFEIFVTDYRH